MFGLASAEFNARADAHTNVTARGILDIGSANVPFTAEVGRYWETIFGTLPRSSSLGLRGIQAL